MLTFGVSYILHVIKFDPAFGGGHAGRPIGQLTLAMSDSSGGIVEATSGTTVVPNDGQFHHVAGTYDGSIMKVYLDGQLVGQAARSGPILATASAPVISHHGGTCLQRAATAIDEIDFYDRPLAALEIQAIFTAGSAGKCKAHAYACTGFEPPFDQPISLKAKVHRAIPLQMQLSSDGIPITNANIGGAPPVVNVNYSAGGGPALDVTNQLEPLGQSSEGNAFRYDAVEGQWIFHLGTRLFTAAGTYTVTAEAGDTTYDISPTCTGQFVRSE